MPLLVFAERIVFVVSCRKVVCPHSPLTATSPLVRVPLSNIVRETTKRILRKPAGGRKFGTAGHSAVLQELIDRKISIYSWSTKCISKAETKEHTHGN